MLKIHSSLTSIAISDFLEEMDISESLKCSRNDTLKTGRKASTLLIFWSTVHMYLLII